MFRKIVFAMLFVYFLLSISGFAFGIGSVRTWTGDTIYIRPDGSIDPSDAPIVRNGDYYILTDDINGDHFYGIYIERDNMTLDCAGHTLRGTDGGYGVFLSGRSNITIENLTVEEYSTGIALFFCKSINMTGNNIVNAGSEGIFLSSSLNSTISGNTIISCSWGVEFISSNNSVVCGNNLSSNYHGIDLWLSSHNEVSENTITKGDGSSYGIELRAAANNTITESTIIDYTYGLSVWATSENNTITKNTIVNGTYGIELSSSNNTIYHNNFINNTIQAYSWLETNIWDNGCEGNYWSDYDGTDLDEDGIGDAPYVIDENNIDRHPLMNCYWNPCDINHDLTVDMRDIGRAARAFGTEPGDERWNCHADITGIIPLEPDRKVDMRDIGLMARNFGETHP